MSATMDVDRRLGDWLEDGPQAVPDWLVEAALEEAHATRQVRRGIGLPAMGRPRPIRWGRLASVAAGAVGALAVIAAFVLGLMSAPYVGEPQVAPPAIPSISPAPTAPASVTPRSASGLRAVDVLPGESPEFVALIGLTATEGAVWTAAATGDSARLVRIDAGSGAATPIEILGAGGILSPPAADGDSVWTGSPGALHRVNGANPGEVTTLPIGFTPYEVHPAVEGLWVAHDGGISLVDRSTGETRRTIAAPAGSRLGRIIGAPSHGALWACLASGEVTRLDPADGEVTANLQLPGTADCHGLFLEVTGITDVEDGVVPYLANVVVDPTGSVASEFDVGQWSDVVAVAGRLWFLEIRRQEAGSLALLALDPVRRGVADVLTFPGTLHLNTAFESGYLAVAGDSVWVLADPMPAVSGDERAEILRIPLAELGVPRR